LFQVGDRVRVRAENSILNGYQAGDVGTVLKVLRNPVGGDRRFCVVAIDKDRLVGGGMAFAEEEIELDL
jgi:hypothetical protein